MLRTSSAVRCRPDGREPACPISGWPAPARSSAESNIGAHPHFLGRYCCPKGGSIELAQSVPGAGTAQFCCAPRNCDRARGDRRFESLTCDNSTAISRPSNLVLAAVGSRRPRAWGTMPRPARRSGLLGTAWPGSAARYSLASNTAGAADGGQPSEIAPQRGCEIRNVFFSIMHGGKWHQGQGPANDR